VNTSVSFSLVQFGMQPQAVTKDLGVEPTYTDVSYVTRCASGRKEECGLWSYDTAGAVKSKELREHLEHLLNLFRPLRSQLEEIRPRPNVIVEVRCEAQSMLRPLRLPPLEPRHVGGIAELGAALKVSLFEKSAP
jgi:hypothetical protein